METKVINNVQKVMYNNEEKKRIKNYLNLYHDIIKKMKTRTQITLLDVGGGGGNFARYIKGQLKKEESKCTKLKIVVIDTVKYNTWDDEEDDIKYVLCDAINIGDIFEKESFDFIFCNMFVHHLIGKSYKDSKNLRKKVFESIRYVLKRDGNLVVADNFNDGLLFDNASCRILYVLTTCCNPILKSLFFKLGAHSAGSGVCMMSERMWQDLLENAGFKIIQKKRSEVDKWGLLKKIVLLNKGYRQECYLVAEKI